MKRYLLLSPANPHMRLLTIDMLMSPEIRYRGDLTLIGPSAQGYEALPSDRTILCIDADEGSVYRPEGNGAVTFLGSILEHVLSRPVKNAVFHGEAASFLFETRQETYLRRAMERAEVEAQAIKDALYGKPISLFEPTLTRIVCEAFRIVCDVNAGALKRKEPASLRIDQILQQVSVDHSEENVAA